jgi:hypothetical protein
MEAVSDGCRVIDWCFLTAFGGHREDALPSWWWWWLHVGNMEIFRNCDTLAQSKRSVLRDWAGRMGKWDGRQPDRGPLILSLYSVEIERSPYRSHPARGSLVGDMHGTARGLARLWFCEAVWDLFAQIISGLRALAG